MICNHLKMVAFYELPKFFHCKNYGKALALAHGVVAFCRREHFTRELEYSLISDYFLCQHYPYPCVTGVSLYDELLVKHGAVQSRR